MNEPSLIAAGVIAGTIFIVAFFLTLRIKLLKKAGCLGAIVLSLVSMSLALGAGWLLFNTLKPADGVVVNRSEQVLTSTRGDWSRSMRVTVAYGGDGVEERSVDFLVDGQSYDDLVEGRPTRIRVLSFGSSLVLARLVEMSPLALMKHTIADLRLSLPDPLAGERLVAPAVIKKMTTVSLDYYINDDNQEQVRELWQPFDLVVFEFVPAGRDDAVVAVDKVDAGSLETGTRSQVEIQYLPENPRTAVIKDASHTYRWKNPLGQLLPGLLVIGLLAMAIITWRLYKTVSKKQNERDGR